MEKSEQSEDIIDWGSEEKERMKKKVLFVFTYRNWKK